MFNKIFQSKILTTEATSLNASPNLKHNSTILYSMVYWHGFHMCVLDFITRKRGDGKLNVHYQSLTTWEDRYSYELTSCYNLLARPIFWETLFFVWLSIRETHFVTGGVWYKSSNILMKVIHLSLSKCVFIIHIKLAIKIQWYYVRQHITAFIYIYIYIYI